MSDQATVYAPLHFFPEGSHLEPFAPGATIETDASAQVATLTWPNLSVTVRRVSDDELSSRLLEMQKSLREKGCSEALALRLLATLSIYEVSAEPGFDVQQRALGLVVGMTQATLGLCLLAEDLLDEQGNSMLKSPPKPPHAGRVAARALSLLAVAARGLIEEDAGCPGESDAENFRQRLVAWTESIHELLAELEPEENDLLRTPIGEAAPQAVVDAVWRAEGAQVLLWALSQRELPAHDTQEHPFALAREAGLLQEVRPKILGASLRSVAQLEAMRLRLAALHWRLVEARLCPSKSVEFAKFATRDFMKDVDLSELAMVDGDLAFQGNAVSRLDQAAIQLGQSIAKERHQAANWLLGVHPVYSLVNTPT